MKNIYNKLIAFIVLVPLGYLSVGLYDQILLGGTTEIIYPGYNYKLLFTSYYGLSVLITLAILPKITKVGLIYLILFSLLGFVLHLFSAKFLSVYTISSMVTNTVKPSFNLYFTFPVFLLFVLFLIEVLGKLNFKKLFSKIPVLSLKLDTRLIRFLAYLIDWVFIAIVYLALSAITVLSPYSILFIMLAYRIVMETLTSQTIGKRLMNNLTIVSNDLTTPRFEQIVKRNLSRLIFIYMFPVLWKGKGLHDKVSKTMVIAR